MSMTGSRLGNERGSALVTVVLFLPVLVLIMVFVLDVGNWWTHKRHVQLQADAAALAGGDLFAMCFTVDKTTAYNAMQAEASRYAGYSASSTGSPVNQLTGPTGQFGAGNQGTLQQPLYNINTGPPDDTVNGNACDTEAFDVKTTESNLPLFFNSVVPKLKVVPQIRAHARVKLFLANGGKPDLPLAVPDVNPKDVAVTFFVKDGTAAGTVLGTFHLNPTGPSNGLNWWTTSAAGGKPANPAVITVPGGYTNIGMLVGLGTNVGNCAAGSSLPQYVCYDYSSTPLVLIRGYSTAGTGTSAKPLERAVWETTTGCGTNSGTPFISDASGKSSCTAVLQAQIDFGATSIDQCVTTCIKADGQPMTYKGGGIWSLGLGVTAGTGSASSVSNLTWTNTKSLTCGNNGKQACKDQSFGVTSPVQQIYSADSSLDVTGPVMSVSLAESGGATGSPYSFAANTTHTLSVTVGLTQDLASVTPPSPNMLLRFQVNKSASRTALINCGATYPQTIAGNPPGCPTAYQINPTGSCFPDPNPGPNPDCVPTDTGLKSSIDNFLDKRFGCPPNNWPSPPPGDPRIVQLVLTDFIGLIGNGNTLLPVNHLATFYVTGWFGSKCSLNESPPPGDSSKGDIWGHFMAYANPADTGNNPCPPITTPGINPCVPELTR